MVLKVKKFFKNILFLFFSKSNTKAKFIIFGRGRSGSTLLVELLNNIENINCEGEILKYKVFYPIRYILGRSFFFTKGGVYGCKILSYQIRDIQKIDNANNFIKKLHSEGFKIIYLKRRNIVKHAISNIRARTFAFHTTNLNTNPIENKIRINCQDLKEWLTHSENLLSYELEALKGVPFIEIIYEDDLLNDESKIMTIHKISEFFGLKIDNNVILSNTIRKISSDNLKFSIENISEVCNYLKDTQYEIYLEN